MISWIRCMQVASAITLTIGVVGYWMSSYDLWQELFLFLALISLGSFLAAIVAYPRLPEMAKAPVRRKHHADLIRQGFHRASMMQIALDSEDPEAILLATYLTRAQSSEPLITRAYARSMERWLKS